MSHTGTQPPPIRSSLACDPELGDLVAQFVGEMPTRVAWLQRHLNAGDWESLRRAVHQMKGAAGSYGFDELVPPALRLETLLSQGASREEIASACGELFVYCRSVTVEPPD